MDLSAETFVVTLENKGNIHHILNQHTLELKVGDKTYEFGKNQLEGLFGQNLLAGKKRNFRLKTPAKEVGKKKAMIRLVKLEN